jgi:mevalonate pyrophosphate decarboxylase
MARDNLYDSLVSRPAIPPGAKTNATLNGTTVDKNYQNNMFRVVFFSIVTATTTDGSHAVTMQDSPDNSAWSTVVAADMAGTLPTITSADANKAFDLAYNGSQRYVRLVLTTSGATTGAIIGASAIMGQGRRTPVTH